MITGILKQWRTGCWMVYDEKAQLNHYVDDTCTLDVKTHDDHWARVEFAPGPGGFDLRVNGYHVPDLVPARLFRSGDNVVPIRRE